MTPRRTWLLSLAFVAIFGGALVSCHLFTDVGGLEGLSFKAPTLSGQPAQLLSDVRAWFRSHASLSDMPQEERLRLLHEEGVWMNDLIMWIFPDSVRQQIPHFWQSWLRCWILCAAVYFGVGALWCYYAYFCFGDKLFPPGGIPEWKDVWQQIVVSNYAMPLYSLLPALTELMAEKGWTMAYPRIENVGVPAYLLYFVLYMSSVEFGVYWNHRLLHSGWGYKYLHYDHHIYNKEHTLSPFAGLAFNPIDGILQAIPYTWTLFFCPMHFLTHLLLLFATGVWTANIHDCLHGATWPIMGAGYHAIHHTTYKHNYGHYFIFMDWFFNTLETPEEHEYKKQQALQAKQLKAQ